MNFYKHLFLASSHYSSFLFRREKEKKQKKNLLLRNIAVVKIVIGDLIGEPTHARYRYHKLRLPQGTPPMSAFLAFHIPNAIPFTSTNSNGFGKFF